VHPPVFSPPSSAHGTEKYFVHHQSTQTEGDAFDGCTSEGNWPHFGKAYKE